MTRFDEDRTRLAGARRRADEQEQYAAAEQEDVIARKVRGTRELRERFRDAVRSLARSVAYVTLDMVRTDMSPSVIGLTLKHTEALAREAGLRVSWDGVIERDATFDAYVAPAPKNLPGRGM